MSTKSVLKNKRKKRNRKIRKIIREEKSAIAATRKLKSKLGITPAQAILIHQKAREEANAANLANTAKKSVKKT